MTDDKEGTGSAKPVQTFDAANFRVKFSEILRFLEANFPSTECPQCHQDEGWNIDISDSDAGENGDEFLQPYRMAHAEAAKHFKVTFMMSCVECGSIRELLAERVLNWLRENPVDTE